MPLSNVQLPVVSCLRADRTDSKKLSGEMKRWSLLLVAAGQALRADITALSVLLNTTLHHEHGILAMFTLGALLAVSRNQPPAPGRLAPR